MEVWGITGAIGSGKSLALDFLKKIPNVFCLDADAIARELLNPYHPSFEKLAKEIASQIESDLWDPQKKELDRDKLRLLVSQNPQKRQRLEETMIPKISLEISRQIQALKPKAKAIFIEGTRLVESGATLKIAKGLICVIAPEPIRKARVKARNPKNFAELWNLGATQNENLMKSASQILWDNSGTPDELYAQIREFLSERKI